jgi:4-oxalocrotonate tautomerase family enzyme
MPIINVTTWASDNQELKEKLIKELTLTTQKVTGARADKITVYITEIPNSLWAEAGVIGDAPDFLEKSCRHSLE